MPVNESKVIKYMPTTIKRGGNGPRIITSKAKL